MIMRKSIHVGETMEKTDVLFTIDVRRQDRESRILPQRHRENTEPNQEAYKIEKQNAKVDEK